MILHWLGDMFDPALAGYWGSRRPAAMETALGVIAAHMRSKVDGIKISLLDKDKEIDHAPPPAARACACTPATTSTTPS